MRLNLPVQRPIDRRVTYEQFMERKPIIDPNSGELLEVLVVPLGGNYGDHHPGDPSWFRHPGTRGWSCPPAAAACVWLGFG